LLQNSYCDCSDITQSLFNKTGRRRQPKRRKWRWTDYAFLCVNVIESTQCYTAMVKESNTILLLKDIHDIDLKEYLWLVQEWFRIPFVAI